MGARPLDFDSISSFDILLRGGVSHLALEFLVSLGGHLSYPFWFMFFLGKPVMLYITTENIRLAFSFCTLAFS